MAFFLLSPCKHSWEPLALSQQQVAPSLHAREKGGFEKRNITEKRLLVTWKYDFLIWRTSPAPPPMLSLCLTPIHRGSSHALSRRKLSTCARTKWPVRHLLGGHHFFFCLQKKNSPYWKKKRKLTFEWTYPDLSRRDRVVGVVDEEVDTDGPALAQLRGRQKADAAE